MTYALLTVLLLLQYFDGLTTYRLLSGGGRELNPVVRFFLDRLGLLPGLLVVKGLVSVAVAAATFYGSMPWWLLVALIAIYIAVVTHNLVEAVR